MRWVSNPQSTEEAVTTLAILETLAASSICIGIFFRYGISGPLYSAIMAAPLLLLRSPDTTREGLRMGNRLTVRVRIIEGRLMDWALPDAKSSILRMLKLMVVIGPIGFLSYPTLILGFQSIRLWVILKRAFKHPLRSLAQIPGNWRRVVLCTDSRTFPELIPGIESHRVLGELEFFRVSTIFWILGRSKLDTLVWLPAMLVLFYVPASLYRWSVKSSALIWSPLILVIVSAKTFTVQELVENTLTKAVYRAARFYAAFVIAAFTAKLYFFYKISGVTFATEEAQFVLSNLVAPNEIPFWQLAGIVSALGTISLYFVCDYVRDRPVDSLPGYFTEGLRWMIIVKNTLSIYTALCAAYITVQTIGTLKLPPLGTKLFPWL